MKKILSNLLITLCFVPILAFAQKQPKGVTYDVEIIRVSDGDTIVIAAPYLPAPLKPELAVRIFGVDTPEKGWRGQCESEKAAGEVASEFAKNLVQSSKQKQVIIYSWDKFGGRILGDIILDGKSLRKLLIDNGHAREYYGDSKQSWCQ
jgi:endonuclease YncB( thermonuclease family)